MDLLFEGKLDGAFEGFNENKVFTFTNGQKWQQARYKYKYRYLYRPTARIWRDGSRYLIDVDGVGEMIQVRKI